MVVFWCEGECVAKESPALQNFFHKFHTIVRDIICRNYVEGLETGVGADMTNCFLFLSEWLVVPGTVFPITGIRPLSRSQMFYLQMRGQRLCRRTT
jgi:hypothetical protein